VLVQHDNFDESAARALDIAISGSDPDRLDLLEKISARDSAKSSFLVETCLIRGMATFGRTEEGIELLSKRLESVWDQDESGVLPEMLRRLIPNTAYFGRPDIGIGLIADTTKRLASYAGDQLPARDKGAILGAAAEAVGKLGAVDESMRILGDIVDIVESLVGEHTQGVSYLFEYMGLVVDQIISQGQVEKGVALIDHLVQTISVRLSKAFGTDHPYFVHQARIKCAIALISLEEHSRGFELLEQTVGEIARVRMFDGRDRVDLCLEGVKALSLVPLQEGIRPDLLRLLVDTGIGEENTANFSDLFRRDMIRGTIRETIQRQSAYRLALMKVRALEERLIRRRVLDETLLIGQ